MIHRKRKPAAHRIGILHIRLNKHCSYRDLERHLIAVYHDLITYHIRNLIIDIIKLFFCNMIKRNHKFCTEQAVYISLVSDFMKQFICCSAEKFIREIRSVQNIDIAELIQRHLQKSGRTIHRQKFRNPVIQCRFRTQTRYRIHLVGNTVIIVLNHDNQRFPAFIIQQLCRRTDPVIGIAVQYAIFP